MQIIEGLNKLGRWVYQNFWALSFWQRSIIAAILGSAGGATLLALFNRYALYGYAYREGLRIPVEGVPYLDLIILLLSFGFLIVSLISVLAVFGLLSMISNWVARLVRITSPGGGRFVDILLSIIILVIAVVGLNELLRKSLFEVYRGKLGFPPEIQFLNAVTIGFFAVVATGALLAISVAIAKNHALLKWLTVLCAIILTGCLLVGLFQPRLYSEFLREIRFGGGVPVSVQYKVDEKTTELDSGMLQIMTSHTVFLKNDQGDFVEIPRERVIRIMYPSRNKIGVSASHQ